MLKISRLFAGVAFGAASLFTVLAHAQTQGNIDISGPSSIEFTSGGYLMYDVHFTNVRDYAVTPAFTLINRNSLDFSQSVSDINCEADITDQNYDKSYLCEGANKLEPGQSTTFKIAFRMPSVCLSNDLGFKYKNALNKAKFEIYSQTGGSSTDTIETTYTDCPTVDLSLSVSTQDTTITGASTYTFHFNIRNNSANTERNAIIYADMHLDLENWDYVSNNGGMNCYVDNDYLDGNMIVHFSEPTLEVMFVCDGITLNSQEIKEFDAVFRPSSKVKQECPERFSASFNIGSQTLFESKLQGNRDSLDFTMDCNANEETDSSSSSSESSSSSVTTTQSSSSSFARVVDESDDAENLPFKGNFLNMTLNNQEVLFKDVPVLDWFAPYVYHLIKAGIASGYNDANGNPLGQYGPANNVTYGEIAKMALNAAGISVNNSVQASNASAQGHWSESYVATMESLGVSMYSSVNVNTPAPRGAVLEILYQVGSIPTVTPTGTVYSDVSAGHQYAGSIETATAAGIVSGDAGSDTFRPNAPINRAETAKILDLYMQTY